MNGVRFLRVESGDLAALGVQLCAEVYGIDRDTEVSLHVQGFEYVPDPAKVAVERIRTVRYFRFNKDVALPARQLDYYSPPEIWSKGAWVVCEAIEDWRIYAVPISRADFVALCRHCNVPQEAQAV